MSDENLHADPLKCMEIIQSVPVSLHYLTEGNANVIYSISPNPNDKETAAHDHCCVLRLRKDLATTRPCIENLTAIRERITPLFLPDHEDILMPKLLYKLTPEVLAEAEAILDHLDTETSRHGEPKRALGKREVSHPSLEEEPHGILMPNFRHGEETIFREFKPKWLRQSPNAPEGAQRCRTCAANAFKRSKGGKKGKGDSGFCPLDLLSSDRALIRGILEKIDPEHGNSEDLVDSFLAQVQPVLHHLYELQGQHDTHGLQDASNPEHRDYAVAMALRDCSLFMVLKKSSDGRLSIDRVKLADLDLKISTAGNLDKWAKMESDLISTGAYTNQTMPGSSCALERGTSNGTTHH
jgi:inositol-pentakisphosphate 2-kinase